jgi:hypothetical protein
MSCEAAYSIQRLAEQKITGIVPPMIIGVPDHTALRETAIRTAALGGFQLSQGGEKARRFNKPAGRSQ